MQFLFDSIIIYNPSSFGGTYAYIKALLPALQQYAPKVEVVLPVNADWQDASTKPLLLADVVEGSALKKKLYFIWRSIINPIKFVHYVNARPNSLIIWNDYDQLTVPFWVPLLKRERLAKQIRAVLLHDPDRDAYPPAKWYAQMTMRQMMAVMDLGAYHEILVDRPYYKNANTRYISIPHGAYALPDPDQTMLDQLAESKTGGFKLAAILGNIRPEKNYLLAIEALVHLPELKLVIAGKPANSSVNLEDYKAYAQRLGVESRIIWLTYYLSEAAFAAVMAGSDLILLAYKSTFKSQSAIFNSLAPFKARVVVADGENAMAAAAYKYQLGTIIQPDNLEALVNGIACELNKPAVNTVGWQTYMDENSWEAAAGALVQAAKNRLEELG